MVARAPEARALFCGLRIVKPAAWESAIRFLSVSTLG
jgi:hypothetical protein